MAKKRNDKKTRSITAEDIEFERARLQIRTNANVRTGLAQFRLHADQDSLWRLGKRLAQHPSYRPIIWPAPYPTRFSELPARGLPYYLGYHKELAWLASILTGHAEKLNSFIQARNSYELLLLSSGQPTEIMAALNRIETEFGQSLWLTEQKLNVIGAKDGWRAAARLRDAIASDHKTPNIIRTLVTWLAYKSMGRVSAAEVFRLLDEQYPLDNGIDFIFHVILGRAPSISESPAGEMLSITDFFGV